MKIAVKDANILIDLAEADLLGLWFKLDYETHTTDLVLREIRRVEQWRKVSPLVDAGLIRLRTFDEAEMRAVVLTSRELRVAVPDASAFVLAKQLRAILLSGDSDLRRAAEASKIRVHGVLWVFDQLIRAEVLQPRDAASRLQRLLDGSSFLPKLACEERLRQWCRVA